MYFIAIRYAAKDAARAARMFLFWDGSISSSRSSGGRFVSFAYIVLTAELSQYVADTNETTATRTSNKHFQKTMPEKDPNSWASLRAVLPILFGAGGGVIRYYCLIKSGRTFKFFEFVGDMLSSIFVGCVLYMLAEGLAQPTEISAVCAAIGGNMGARAFQIVESFFEKKLGIQEKSHG